MANEVYANGRELACKAGAGKTIAAFPDVCFTPPENPATPPGVPVPYPNTGPASNTTEGSKNVKISGEEVMLKNSSYFKTSVGDDAGCAAKKGIISSEDKGKVYFTAWSMDVKFEGENVDRHLDLTTDNHAASQPGNTPPWPFIDSQAVGSGDPCEKEKQKEETACKDYKPNKPDGENACKKAGLSGDVIQRHKEAKAAGFSSAGAWADAMSKNAAANECISARRCKLVPYDSKKDGVNGCCPSQTADHIIPKASFFKESFKGGAGAKLDSWPNYDYQKASCMCAEGGSNTVGSHGLRHAHHKANGPEKGVMQSFEREAKLASQGAAEVFKSSGCSAECIEAQLKAGHKGMGSGDIKHQPSGSVMSNTEITAKASEYKPEVVAP